MLEYIFICYMHVYCTGTSCNVLCVMGHSIFLLVILSNVETLSPLACYLEVLVKFWVDIVGFCSFS